MHPMCIFFRNDYLCYY